MIPGFDQAYRDRFIPAAETVHHSVDLDTPSVLTTCGGGARGEYASHNWRMVNCLSCREKGEGDG